MIPDHLSNRVSLVLLSLRAFGMVSCEFTPKILNIYFRQPFVFLTFVFRITIPFFL